jgi:hypothetical protein
VRGFCFSCFIAVGNQVKIICSHSEQIYFFYSEFGLNIGSLTLKALFELKNL